MRLKGYEEGSFATVIKKIVRHESAPATTKVPKVLPTFTIGSEHVDKLLILWAHEILSIFLPDGLAQRIGPDA